MQTVTVEISGNDGLKALQTLEHKHLIRIVEQTDIDAPSLPGKPLSISEFKTWISDAETSPQFSLKEAKSRWAQKRKQLQKLTK